MTCEGVSVYPSDGGMNHGYYLQYSTSSKTCALTSNRTSYHAFRSGDMRQCIADGRFDKDYTKAYNAIKNITINYTVWFKDYPYVIGMYAAADEATAATAYKCEKPIECAKVAPDGTNTAIWSAKADGVTVEYFIPELEFFPEQIECLLWSAIDSSNPNKLDAAYFDLKGADAVYVCDGTPLRVFSCLTNEADCIANRPTDANITQETPVWRIYEARGKDADEVEPELYCAHDGRQDYMGTSFGSTALDWWYDFSAFEFYNGEICSYDKKLIESVKAGFIFPTRTSTGLTDEQLAIINPAVTQTTTSAKQDVWTSFKTAYDSAVNSLASATTVTINGNSYTKDQIENLRYYGNAEGRMGLWEYEEMRPTTTATGARRVLRQLALGDEAHTCAILEDYGFTLDVWWEEQLTPTEAYNLMTDAIAEYDAAVAASTASYTAALMYSSSDLTQSGFITADIKNYITSLNTEAQALAGSGNAISDANVQQAIANYLKTGGTGSFGDEAASTVAYKKLAFEMALAKLRAGDQADPNGVADTGSRANTSQVTKRTSGAGYWPKTTDIAATSYALLKEWFPIGVTVASSKYSCDLGWIMHRMVSQRELANALYIAKTFHADFYSSATTLTSADTDAFFPAARSTDADYYLKDTGLQRDEMTTF